MGLSFSVHYWYFLSRDRDRELHSPGRTRVIPYQSCWRTAVEKGASLVHLSTHLPHPLSLLPFLSPLLSPACPSSGESAPQGCFRGCHRSYVVSQKSRRGAFGERTMIFSSCPWLFMASACWSPGRGAVGMFGDYFRKLVGRCALGQRENRQPMWAIQCAFRAVCSPQNLVSSCKEHIVGSYQFCGFYSWPRTLLNNVNGLYRRRQERTHSENVKRGPGDSTVF